MKYFILSFLMISNVKLFAQVSKFGTYSLKTTVTGDSVTSTILILNCDFTYSRYNSNTKEWGKWLNNGVGAIILDRDSISNNGNTIEYHLKSYYRYRNEGIFFDEREYSKKAFKKEIKEANEIFRKNKIKIKAKDSDEEYIVFKATMMGRYFQKIESLDCK